MDHYLMLQRDGCELHLWHCTERHIAENTSCYVRADTGLLHADFHGTGPATGAPRPALGMRRCSSSTPGNLLNLVNPNQMSRQPPPFARDRFLLAYPRWIAHRGAGKLALKTPGCASGWARSTATAYVRCDAKLSADGVPLLHDATLERTTNGHGTGGDLPLARLRNSMRAVGIHAPTLARPYPRWRTLARFCIANGFLNIEIKPTPGQEETTGRGGRNPRGCGRARPCAPLFSSSSPTRWPVPGHRSAHSRALLLDTLWDGCLDTPAAWAAVAIKLQPRAVGRRLVAQVKGMGMRTLSYTVNDDWAASA